MIPKSTLQHYKTQQKISVHATSLVNHLWQKVTPDFSSFLKIEPVVVQAITVAQSAAAKDAAAYIPQVLAETGQPDSPVADLELGKFSGVASDGRSLQTLTYESVIKAKSAVKAGQTPEQALHQAGRWLQLMTLTQIADAARAVSSTAIAIRPQIGGYVRMLNPPSCSRCIILAGKWYRWNQGFLRHPRCDCRHIPASESIAGDFLTDPYEYFNSLSKEDQEKLFGRVNARAIRDGADIYRVVNISNRGVGTVKTNRIYGTPMVTVDQIYRTAGTRTRAINLLNEHGYITGPQVGGGNIFGKYHESYSKQIDPKKFVPGSKRDRVLQARASGVRNPLDRATMTAAERRLYDAHYRLEYAERTGYLARSIGGNSADDFANLRRATADDIAVLRGELSQIVATLGKQPKSMNLLADKLGITGTTSNDVKTKVPAPKPVPASTGKGGDAKPPDRTTPSPWAYSPEPENEGYAAYWRARQDALDTNKVSDNLKPHEVVFYEQFIKSGNRIRLIERPPHTENGRKSSNDFIWIDRGGIEVEIKSFYSAKYDSVADAIQEAVTLARDNHGVTKDTFIIYSRNFPPHKNFFKSIKKYNRRRTSAQVKRLYWWDGKKLQTLIDE